VYTFLSPTTSSGAAVSNERTCSSFDTSSRTGDMVIIGNAPHYGHDADETFAMSRSPDYETHQVLTRHP